MEHLSEQRKSMVQYISFQVKSLLRALHALSRSVHHLKTTFDNKHFVEFVVDCLLNESDSEFLTLATSLIGYF